MNAMVITEWSGINLKHKIGVRCDEVYCGSVFDSDDGCSCFLY